VVDKIRKVFIIEILGMAKVSDMNQSTIVRGRLMCHAPYNFRGCTGFDRELEVGEAIRSYALNANLNINAEDNLAYAA